MEELLTQQQMQLRAAMPMQTDNVNKNISNDNLNFHSNNNNHTSNSTVGNEATAETGDGDNEAMSVDNSINTTFTDKTNDSYNLESGNPSTDASRTDDVNMSNVSGLNDHTFPGTNFSNSNNTDPTSVFTGGMQGFSPALLSQLSPLFTQFLAWQRLMQISGQVWQLQQTPRSQSQLQLEEQQRQREEQELRQKIDSHRQQFQEKLRQEREQKLRHQEQRLRKMQQSKHKYDLNGFMRRRDEGGEGASTRERDPTRSGRDSPWEQYKNVYQWDEKLSREVAEKAAAGLKVPSPIPPNPQPSAPTIQLTPTVPIIAVSTPAESSPPADQPTPPDKLTRPESPKKASRYSTRKRKAASPPPSGPPSPRKNGN